VGGDDKVRLRLLGPVQVDIGGSRADVGPAKQVCLLACLLLTPGRAVAVETIIDRIWDEAPPRHARNVVATYVTRLRAILRHTGCPETVLALRYAYGGYLAECDPRLVDLHRARYLVGEARKADDRDATALLDQALREWEPVAVAGVPGQWAQRVRERLADERLGVLATWATMQLRADRLDPVVERLEPAHAQYPSSEELALPLMTALARAGRTVQASRCYHRLYEALDTELGVAPSPRVRELYGQIQHATGALPVPDDPRRRPAQLPPDVRGFAGRGRELDQLDAVLDPPVGQPTAMAVAVISGPAGVGKTTLAVHWAHKVRDRFPAGQLYANLRGFAPGGSMLDPAEALRGFLDALGVPPQRMPEGSEAQAALYRSLLASRRMLIVLDNARDAQQVRPLLPGGPGCLVLVTSRHQLAGLVALEAASPLVLDLLSAAEAHDLLARRIGVDRVSAEPEALARIIDCCARLPLALAIAAARAATSPVLRLADLAAELYEARSGLDALDNGDPASNVRVVFSWSYHTLSAPAARLFRLLGLHPGPDLSAHAAASLAGVQVGQVGALLAQLARANLVNQPTAGRYVLHDLLRAYAAELAETYDSNTDRHAAVRRMLDHYLHTAHRADQLLHPGPDADTVDLPQPFGAPEELTDPGQALSWFSTEHAVLLAAVEQANHDRFDTHTWQLAWVLTAYLQRRGYWRDQEATQRTALQAAQRLPDPAGQIRALRGLGRACARLGRIDEAHGHLAEALQLHATLDDNGGRARTHLDAGWLFERQGRPTEALSHARLALRLYQAADDQAGQGRALNDIGWAHSLLGKPEQALGPCQQARCLLHAAGDRSGEAAACDSIGYAHHLLGNHHDAITCYRQAIDLLRTLNDRYCQADVLTHLGDTQHAAGNPDAARHAWQQALTILDELGHTGAEQVRDKLVQATNQRDP
jgi:DNA-binding SARP family transcriptional activator